MTAVWMRVRGEFRSRWRATFGVALVIALAGGIVLAALAGASRTQSAYPRFERATNGGQGGIASDPGHFFGFANVDFDKAEKLPQVIESAHFAFFIAFVNTPSRMELRPFADRNPLALVARPDDRFGPTVRRVVARQGHLPDPSRVDEAAVSLDAATRY